MKILLLIAIMVVLFSLEAGAFEINDSGADFSVKDQFSASIYFENLGGQKIGIQSNNNFGYFNRFTKLDNKTTKWDLVFNRVGRPDILKIVVVIPNANISKNTVFVNDYLINFDDAIAQGFNVELNSVENDVEVSISNFSEIFGPITIDPTIIDTSELSLTNYGNTIVRDSSGNIFTVQEVVVASGGNTDIFVSKSTDDGVSFTSFNLTNSSDVNELLPHIDINSTDGLIIEFDGNDSRNIFVTTCSTGGCDANSEFLDKVNVSDCGNDTCANGNIVHDQNGTSHISYAKNQSDLQYRLNTGFVGASWGSEEDVGSVGGGAIIDRDGTGILIANNGSGIKIVFTNANGAQANIGFFNGTLWSPSVLELEGTGVQESLSGFAGYDGNFYVTYAKDVSSADTSGQIHYRECITDCNLLASWSTDVNVTSGGLNLSWVSLFQSSDLNVNIFSSSLVSAADANLFHFVRTPNNVFTTSNIADGNLLFSDANRTYNPLVRNRDYDGQVLALAGLPTIGNVEIDYVFLTSANAQGDPSTLLFDSNSYPIANGITAAFTITPGSPFVLTPEVSNIAVDLNSTTEFFGSIVDINYLWQIDGEELSTDQNIIRDFNGVDEDFNISLIVEGNDGSATFTSQSDQNVNLVNVTQVFDINFGLNKFLNNADINIGGTFGGGTAGINSINWGGTDIDVNRSGLQFTIDHNAGGIKQICGVFNTSGNIDTVYCEEFNITEVLVKIPLDEEVPATTLTTFIIAVDGTAPQNYSAESADLNVFMFDQNTSQYINISVDFNASYFPRNYGIFTGQPDNLFFTIQPYLALVANSIQVNWITQDVLANSSLSNIRIRSQRSIASILTEVESPFTDITGSATLTFIPQITYTLTFDLNGDILGTGVYIPASSDTQKKAFLNVTDINTGTFIQSALDVNFTPAGGVLVLPSDFNATTITQDVNVFDGNLQSLRILVTHGSATLSDTNQTSAGTFTQTLALSGRDLNTLLVVQVTAVISGQSFLVQKVYGLRATPGLEERFTTAKDQDIGHTGATLLAVILTAVAIGGLIGLNRSETQDNSSLSFIAIPILMFFAFLNWVSWIPIIFGSAAAIILYFSNRASKGGFA